MSIGLFILIQLPPVAIILGCVSVPLIALYPLMKRVTFWPQIFLGLTFNFGALIGWSAVTNNLSVSAFFLYAAGLFWTLGYDTIYAHQDKEDDILIGVKSTALKFGKTSKKWVSAFYAFSFLFICLSFLLTGENSLFVSLSLLPIAGHMVWQIWQWDMDNQESCLKTFKSNRDLGLIICLGAFISYLF